MPGWVYGIRHRETSETIYVGSCIRQYLCQRKGDHTKPTTYTRKRQPQLQTYVKEHGDWDCFEFYEIERYDTIDRKELLVREKYHINTLSPLCNVKMPCISHEEYNERKKEYAKQWRARNPDKAAAINQAHRSSESYKQYQEKRCSTQVLCECGGRYTMQNKTNHVKRDIHIRWLTNSNSCVS